MTHEAFDDERMVHLVRNALIVAGQEMGDGDQWPVIKDTIYKIMKDWEDLKIERNVFDEIRKHCAHTIRELEQIRATCDDDLKVAINKSLQEMRAVYYAAFTQPAPEQIYMDADTIPAHIKRADEILKTMED